MKNKIENINQSQSPEKLFCFPVKLLDTFEIKNFHSNAGNIEYLIISNERYYKINEAAYNLIIAIQNFSDLASIAKEFSIKQKQNYTINDVVIVINELLVPIGIIATPTQIEFSKRKSILYFKIPIFTEKILNLITKLLQHLFKPYIAFPILSVILISHVFFFSKYMKEINVLNIIDRPYLLLITIVISLVSTIFHEFGHSSASRYFGTKHKEIGFGLYLTMPVFYSNVSDCWSLKYKQRAVVDIAGLYFQYIFNVFLFVVFLISGNLIIIYVILLICIQSVFTLNPFFRFDGYWLASDLLGVPNLRKRTKEYIKYLVNRYVYRKNVDCPILNVNVLSKYIFYSYSIISNAFFIFFIVIIAKTTPLNIQEVSKFYKELHYLIINSNIQINLMDVGLLVYKLFFRIVILGISGFFIFKIIKQIYVQIKLVVKG